MKLEKIKYADLKSRQKEIYNFQKVAGLLADYGFNCIKLADDWQSADFLAYHRNGKDTLKIQLKSRITISKKYSYKKLYMSFPIKDNWYLIEHDELIKLIKKMTSWLSSESWKIRGNYSYENPNKKLIEALNDSKL